MQDSALIVRRPWSGPNPCVRLATFAACCGLVASLLGGASSAQAKGLGSGGTIGNWVQRGVILPDSGYGVVDNYFGRAVSASGSKIVVGAPSLGGGTGLAHILDTQGDLWFEEAVLSSSLAQLDDDFGISVSAYYGTIMVGAPGEDTRAGSVHVYDQTTGVWLETSRIVSPGPVANGEFGTAVALSRGAAAIGAPGEERVYVYRLEGGLWVLDATITTPGAAGGEFGSSLAFDGTHLVIGAPEDGRAFLYTNTGLSWSYTLELLPLPSPNTEEFGTAVALDSTLVAVTSPREEGQGEVHVYRFDGFNWQADTLLTPPATVAPELSFGEAISIEASTIAVGAPGDDQVYGTVFLFEDRNGTWDASAQLVPPPGDGVSEGNFGRYVALYRGVILANLGLEDSPVFQNYAGSVTVWGQLEPSSLALGNSNGIRSGNGFAGRLGHVLRRFFR